MYEDTSNREMSEEINSLTNVDGDDISFDDDILIAEVYGPRLKILRNF